MRSSYEYMNYLQVVQVLCRNPNWSIFIRPQQSDDHFFVGAVITGNRSSVSKSSIHGKFDEQSFFCFEAIVHGLPTTRTVLFLPTLVWELVVSVSGGWQTLQLSIKLKLNLKMKSSLALANHRSEIREIVLAHRAVNARVFGSVAQGLDTDLSDLDILVDTTSETTLFDLGAIRYKLRNLLGVPVDVLTPGALPDSFRQSVIAQAQPI